MITRQLGRNGPTVSALDAAFPPNAAAGARYGATMMSAVNR